MPLNIITTSYSDLNMIKGLDKQAATAMATVHIYVDKSTLIIVLTDAPNGCAL